MPAHERHKLGLLQVKEPHSKCLFSFLVLNTLNVIKLIIAVIITVSLRLFHVN